MAVDDEKAIAKSTFALQEAAEEIAFEELDMLIGKLKGATTYKALNTIEGLSTTEKRILEKVFNIIDSMKIRNRACIIETILEEFAREK